MPLYRLELPIYIVLLVSKERYLQPILPEFEFINNDSPPQLSITTEKTPTIEEVHETYACFPPPLPSYGRVMTTRAMEEANGPKNHMSLPRRFRHAEQLRLPQFVNKPLNSQSALPISDVLIAKQHHDKGWNKPEANGSFLSLVSWLIIEIKELEEAIATHSRDAVANEVGDVLYLWQKMCHRANAYFLILTNGVPAYCAHTADELIVPMAIITDENWLAITKGVKLALNQAKEYELDIDLCAFAKVLRNEFKYPTFLARFMNYQDYVAFCKKFWAEWFPSGMEIDFCLLEDIWQLRQPVEQQSQPIVNDQPTQLTREEFFTKYEKLIEDFNQKIRQQKQMAMAGAKRDHYMMLFYENELKNTQSDMPAKQAYLAGAILHHCLEYCSLFYRFDGDKSGKLLEEDIVEMVNQLEQQIGLSKAHNKQELLTALNSALQTLQSISYDYVEALFLYQWCCSIQNNYMVLENLKGDIDLFNFMIWQSIGGDEKFLACYQKLRPAIRKIFFRKDEGLELAEAWEMIKAR